MLPLLYQVLYRLIGIAFEEWLGESVSVLFVNQVA